MYSILYTARRTLGNSSFNRVKHTHHLNISAIRDENLLRYERLKKKTYIRMLTNKGPLNLELHSDMVCKVDYDSFFSLYTLTAQHTVF